MVQLGQTVFDLSAQMLRDSTGAKIALRAQSSRVLECLIEAKGALVTKDHLFKTVWPDVSVTDDSLVQCIREIRNAIGDPDHAIVQTEARRGYRLMLNGHDKTVTLGASPTPAALTPDPSSAPIALPVHNADGLITPAIAVMAFSSRDGDERSERLAMTFAGDLITELARHKELRVIGRFASFSLKGQTLSSKEVCDKLNARFIVSGQVQFTETTIQWSLEMMDGQNDEVVWSERKQVRFSDIYDETAALFWRIAGTIVANFSFTTIRKSLAKPPDSLNAYDLCARALATGNRYSIENNREALKLATEATTLYPQYARAWRTSAIINLFDIAYRYSGKPADVLIPQALKEAHKAIALDATQASAYGVLANTLVMNGQHAEAMLASERAIALAPGDPTMLHTHAVILYYRGRFADSEALFESFLSLCPVRINHYVANYGRTLFGLGKHDEAIRLLNEVVDLTPGHNAARAALVAALEETGDHASAARHYALLQNHSNGFNQILLGRQWKELPEVRARYIAAFQAQGMRLETSTH
jgi:TolB-like protein/DNA-binding winged helix-turn-helix (wHTH) protein/Tfp pilus assembly protein PilF